MAAARSAPPMTGLPAPLMRRQITTTVSPKAIPATTACQSTLKLATARLLRGSWVPAFEDQSLRIGAAGCRPVRRLSQIDADCGISVTVGVLFGMRRPTRLAAHGLAAHAPAR